jgi:thiol-disulfide isomerase/thioredoxin
MGLRMDDKMPPLDGGTDWFNSQPLGADYFENAPTLIHFWAVSCHSCKDSIPDVERWVDTYTKQGLKLVSVHMPRQESDTNLESVKEAIAEYHIKWPCVVDNWHTIADAFQNKYVPAYYLFDREGKLRHFQAGEKAAKMVEPVIQRVLAASEEKVPAES